MFCVCKARCSDGTVLSLGTLLSVSPLCSPDCSLHAIERGGGLNFHINSSIKNQQGEGREVKVALWWLQKREEDRNVLFSDACSAVTKETCRLLHVGETTSALGDGGGKISRRSAD